MYGEKCKPQINLFFFSLIFLIIIFNSNNSFCMKLKKKKKKAFVGFSCLTAVRTPSPSQRTYLSLNKLTQFLPWHLFLVLPRVLFTKVKPWTSILQTTMDPKIVGFVPPGLAGRISQQLPFVQTRGTRSYKSQWVKYDCFHELENISSAKAPISPHDKRKGVIKSITRTWRWSRRTTVPRKFAASIFWVVAACYYI